jgi:uncharacterized protein YndB with AHSA1/START domain
METSIDTTSVEREIAIAASPETVWEFLVDSDKATRWMGTSASLDPRPGGGYRVQVIPANTAVGEFVELDPPRRLVYTWGWEPGGGSSLPPGATRIEIDLIPDGDGTRLLFAHRDLPTAEEARRHGLGWDHYLGRLATIAAGGDPGPDPMVERGPTR